MSAVLKLVFGFFFCVSSMVWADNTTNMNWYRIDDNKQTVVKVHLFLSDSCPHCQKTDAFFRELETQTPWLEIQRYMINQDKAALETFNQYLKGQHSNDFSVPAIFFCDSRWVGFKEAESSGKELLNNLNYCRQQINNKGGITPVALEVLRQHANAYRFISLSNPVKISAAAFIPMVALTDALNPCSIFCLLALFAFLWLEPELASQLRLGAVFVFMVGVVHVIQQTQAAFFFSTLPWALLPVAVLGICLLAYAFPEYLKIEIRNKPYRTLLLIACTATAIQMYQQICTPNFSLIFEQWLADQSISGFRHYFYQGIYQLIYILPLVLIMFGIIALTRTGRMAKYQTLLSTVSLRILLIIAILFIVYPFALAKLWFSFLSAGVALLAGWMGAKKK